MSRPRSILGLPGRNRKGSNSSVPKVTATESPEEKARYKINTKADPRKAISEQQPSQAQEQNTMGNLRNLEHRDNDGNLITDPDASNPTRCRLERPLDTIRSFEAAVDGYHHNQMQSYRAESASPMSPQNRRSIYVHGYQHAQSRNMYDTGRGGAYYGNRNSMGHFRSDENSDGFGGPGQYNTSRRFGPKNNSDPALYGHNANQGIYPSHGQQPSYDTVGTVSNQSHATEQWGNSTDPSSENSSVDKFQPGPPKQDLGEIYGFNGFGAGPQLQGPILEEHGHDAPSYGQPGYGQSQNESGNTKGYPYQGNDFPPPTVPVHGVPRPPYKEAALRAPIRLGASTAGAYNSAPPPVPSKREKRKSWLGRRLSKS